MESRRRSFATKLVAALAVPVLLLAALTLVVTFLTTRRYMATVDQSLNRNLAAHIVGQAAATGGRDGLAAMFDGVMSLNPAAEVYLLDPDGMVLRHAAPPDRPVHDRVALGPLRAFLAEPATLPIYGEDPREPGKAKVFSAAPLVEDGRVTGYLYVVLGGEAYRTVVEMLAGDHILRLSLLVLGAGLALALLIGILASRLLMRRLSGLARAMARFERSGFRAPLPAELRARPIDGDEIDRITATFAVLAQRIAQQFTALEQVDEQRREMVMHLSHDLKTPLATLQSYLETLLIRWDRLPSDQRQHYLQSALGFSQRLDRMIADLFELARLDTAQAPLRPEPFPLHELLQDVCQKLSHSADRGGIALEVADEAQEGRFVVADIGLIERALTNLVENAIKFTPRGGRVTVGLAESLGRITVTIADTGSGIPPDDLPHVFDRFYRVAAGSPAAAGTGLGLAIVKRVAELHQGRVEVTSSPGEGSVFRLVLPAGLRDPVRTIPAPGRGSAA